MTRPKKRLIIYDEDSESRETIMKFWNKISAVDVVSEKFI